MLFELIELPRMEIGDKIAILLEHPTRHPVIECLGQIVQSEPEQRKTDQRSDGSRYLHHTILHKPSARFRKMHITPRNKGRIQRRVVTVAHSFDFRLDNWEHTRLSVAVDRTSRHTFQDFLRTGKVCLLRLPVVHTMTGHFMSLIHDALHHLRRILRKVSRAEKSSTHTILFQDIKDTVGTDL